MAYFYSISGRYISVSKLNWAMESLVEGINSLPMSRSIVTTVEYSPPAVGTSRPPHPPPLKQSTYEGSSSGSCVVPIARGTNKTYTRKDLISSQRSHFSMRGDVMYDSCSDDHGSNAEKGHFESTGDDNMGEDCIRKLVLTLENEDHVHHPIVDTKNCNSNGLVESVEFASNSMDKGPVELCRSPQNSFYSATQYIEAKQSFTNTEGSECASSVKKSVESGEVGNSFDVESRKTSIYRDSTGSDVSDDSSSTSLNSATYKPHKGNDKRWEAIQAVRSHNNGALGLKHFRIFKKLGCGDIGSVHLAELIGTRSYFAMKVMNKEALASRKKLLRAQTEREILQSLDHPFLPTLYTHFETEKLSFLVMEFCPGGDLHALRQRQPGKYFPEHAAR